MIYRTQAQWPRAQQPRQTLLQVTFFLRLFVLYVCVCVCDSVCAFKLWIHTSRVSSWVICCIVCAIGRYSLCVRCVSSYLMCLMSFERALFCIQAKWLRPQHPCQALLQVTLCLLYVWVCVYLVSIMPFKRSLSSEQAIDAVISSLLANSLWVHVWGVFILGYNVCCVGMCVTKCVLLIVVTKCALSNVFFCVRESCLILWYWYHVIQTLTVLHTPSHTGEMTSTTTTSPDTTTGSLVFDLCVCVCLSR